MIQLTEKNNGQQIEVLEGETIVIDLQENPTTGYRWAIERLDENIVTLSASKNILGEGSGIGGGGLRRLTFTAKNPGKTTITLRYWRDWEGEASIVNRFEVTFIVK